MPVITTNTRPRCPNHGCDLDGYSKFPMPKKGIGRCPVSGAEFAFEAEVDEEVMTKDKNGNLSKGTKFNVTGEE